MADGFLPLGPTVIEAVLASGHRVLARRGRSSWKLDIAPELLGVPSIFPMWARRTGAAPVQLIGYLGGNGRASVVEMLQERSIDATPWLLSTLERMEPQCPPELRGIFAQVGKLHDARRLINDFYEVRGALGTLLVYACWYPNARLRLLNFGAGFGPIEREWSTRPVLFEALPFAQRGRVIWGGSDPRNNVHHLSRTERFAVDVEPDPNCPRPRAIAPVAGRVVAAHDGESDELEQHDLRRATNRFGNFVTIRQDDIDVDVTLAHLARGSVIPRVGERIEAGSGVGIIGNSGRSTRRHLHVQAATAAAPHHAVPITYRYGHDVRREFVRGDLVNPE